MEEELDLFCKNIPIDKLEKISDWSSFCPDDEELTEYWAERDGFESGVAKCGKTTFPAFVRNEDNDGDHVFLFVADTIEEVKKKLKGKKK